MLPFSSLNGPQFHFKSSKVVVLNKLQRIFPHRNVPLLKKPELDVGVGWKTLTFCGSQVLLLVSSLTASLRG